MKVFFSKMARYCSAIDVFNQATGLGLYSGKSLEQFKEQYPDVTVVDDQVAIDHDRISRMTSPVEITEDRFNEMLEVLPPRKWQRGESAEAFHVSERITHDIVDWFVRIGEKFYNFANSETLSADDAIRVASVLHFKGVQHDDMWQATMDSPQDSKNGVMGKQAYRHGTGT